MRDRSLTVRLLPTLALAGLALGAHAQEAAPAAAPAAAYAALTYTLAGLAAVQAIIILALSGVLRNLSGVGGPAGKEPGPGSRAWAVVPLLLLAGSARAQAYRPSTGPSYDATVWWLVAVNGFLLVVILLQLRWIRSFAAMIAPRVAVARPEGVKRPSWPAGLMARLNRQVEVRDEKKIELEHDYDGIKELDNVLPPWWLWLFYGTIAWGVIYLVNVHVLNVWPDSQKEYRMSMERAKADVAAYLATQTNLVDENNVTFTDEAAVIAEGRSLFGTNCTACHGADAAGSENSVGPNLTDAYWMHGGGIRNVFHTIKYGVPEKGMIAWKAQLQPSEIRAIACYILTQEGKGGADQKPPQGEQWKEEGGSVPADSTAAAP